jgi:hypothetical protein
VLVEAQAAGNTSIGYSYANTTTATPIKDTLIEVVRGRDAMAVPGHWVAMMQAIRNLGRPALSRWPSRPSQRAIRGIGDT